jgi:hypothetical protein
MSSDYIADAGAVITTAAGNDFIPCVRYAKPSDTGPLQLPKLNTVFEPVPDGVAYASPIYLVTAGRFAEQRKFATGHEIQGYHPIAFELQAECERDNRVIYPVYIESDAYFEVGKETVMEWYRDYVEAELGIPFDSCTLFYTGSRSIHVHVPKFLTSESERQQFEQHITTYCEKTGTRFDTSLYSPKSQFRLPGVIHSPDTGTRKTEIRSHWDHDRIFRESVHSDESLPSSFEEVIRRVFTPERTGPYTSADVHTVLDDEEYVLSLSEAGSTIPVPLIEQEERPTDSDDAAVWNRYNSKEFSPYAHATGDRRSVAVVRVEGGAFSRKSVRGGWGADPVPLVPVYFYGAKGCDGNFIKHNQHAPLQLSKRDYPKWLKSGYSTGDSVVVIGGKSGESRIFGVDEATATATAHLLMKTDGRRAALNYLETEGFEVGTSGPSSRSPKTVEAENGGRRRRPRSETSSGVVQPIQSPTSEAGRLQQRAERDGILSLDHEEKSNVANRLLQIYGWGPAWTWFRIQFGEKFKPDITHREFTSVIKQYDDLSHIQVPPPPK